MTKENDKTHNGWSNYATWRVYLECIDSIKWVKEDFVPAESELSLADIADHLQNVVEQMVSDQGQAKGLAYDYAMAFLQEVNWREMAKYFVEQYPDMVTPKLV